MSKINFIAEYLKNNESYDKEALIKAVMEQFNCERAIVHSYIYHAKKKIGMESTGRVKAVKPVKEKVEKAPKADKPVKDRSGSKINVIAGMIQSDPDYLGFNKEALILKVIDQFGCARADVHAYIYHAKKKLGMESTPRVKKEKAVKQLKITVSTVGEENRRIKTADVSSDDIAAIKAANLKRMKAVSQKYAPGQSAAYVEPNMPHPNFDDARRELKRIEDELDGITTSVDKEMEQERDYPTTLNREQMLGLIG